MLRTCERRQASDVLKFVAFSLAFAALITINVKPELVSELRRFLLAPGLQPVLLFGTIMVACSAAYYAWLFYGSLRYKAVAGVSDAELPTVTVVVPAYNEGPLVADTLKSLAASDYPPEKLQIIAVDDGSQDDTWQWIRKAESELAGRVLALQLKKNSGKRRALYEGFSRADGEVLVTVDSDSIVDPCTLRNLVSPFVGDDDCGAVAGNVRVLNKEASVIPKMLDVSFTFSFEFIRSAQSYYKTVLCTPGALAAYRRDLVLNVLDEWLNQRFLGREANIGEDRAITNLVLRQGKSVLFQANALVYTAVPARYKNLCKMFIRWGRSNIRENLRMQQFVFTNFRSHHRVSARLICCVQQLWSIPMPLLFGTSLFLTTQYPAEMFLTIFGGVALWSSLPAILYFRKTRRLDALWAYAYGIFFATSLAWITSFSLLTVHRTGWLTRNLNSEKTNEVEIVPVPPTPNVPVKVAG